MSRPYLPWLLTCDLISKVMSSEMYSVFKFNVPLAVRFAMVTIGVRKADSSEYGILGRDFY